mmetsp:Transcript_26851/g.60638  ORF Transcript_26851/g.60638 Transcript_26851/m.60638 type:complete len:481 (+) Transcript_26851:1-1443(+)
MVPAPLANLPPAEPACWGPRVGPEFVPGSDPVMNGHALAPPEVIIPVIKATWIEVADTAAIVKEGWPAMAPAFTYDAQAQELLSSASYLVYELSGAAMDSMTLAHDYEWTDFPDIGAALRRAGVVEIPYCLATISLGEDKQKWAVGLATNTKHRTHAAKLALAIALAADAPTLRESITNHPGFRELCEASGIYTGDVMAPPADAHELVGRRKRRRRGSARDAPLPLPKMPLSQAFKDWHYKTTLCRDFEQNLACPRGESCFYAHGPEELRKPGEAEPHELKRIRKSGDFKAKEEVQEEPDLLEEPGETGLQPDAGYGALKCAEPLWIELDPLEEIPSQLEGLPMEALTVSSSVTSGARRPGGLLGQADQILAAVMGDEAKELIFVDDADWKLLPAVGAALKRRKQTEECFTVAISPGRSLWAVGVGMKSKSRWIAVKLAIAAAVVLQQEEFLFEPPDLSQFPLMKQLIKESGEAKKLLFN